MREASKIFLLVALVAMFIGGLVGVVALIEFSHRDLFYREPVEATVTDIHKEYISGCIDTTDMRYKRGYWDEYMTFSVDGTYYEFRPAFIPDNLKIGDTVRLYLSHSGGLFDFDGNGKVIEYNGEFLRSY